MKLIAMVEIFFLRALCTFAPFLYIHLWDQTSIWYQSIIKLHRRVFCIWFLCKFFIFHFQSCLSMASNANSNASTSSKSSTTVSTVESSYPYYLRNEVWVNLKEIFTKSNGPEYSNWRRHLQHYTEPESIHSELAFHQSWRAFGGISQLSFIAK